MRQGPWKLAVTSQNEGMGFKAKSDASGKAARLYNLDDEIGEQTNVADKHPEIVAKLKALADKMDVEIGGKNPPGRRPAGISQNPKMLYSGETKQNGKAKAKDGDSEYF